jgi:hypothetical protein
MNGSDWDISGRVGSGSVKISSVIASTGISISDILIAIGVALDERGTKALAVPTREVRARAEENFIVISSSADTVVVVGMVNVDFVKTSCSKFEIRNLRTKHQFSFPFSASLHFFSSIGTKTIDQ